MFDVPDSGPIGLSLMVVVSEAFLQYIEKDAIQQALQIQCNPISFLRYVDDSHSRFKSVKEANSFLKVLNAQDRSIQYTMELEDEHKQLGFLDVMSRNNLNGKYEFKIHRKNAITNVQTKPHSSINPNIISGIFKGFLVRATRICSKKFLLEKSTFLSILLLTSGRCQLVFWQREDKQRHRSLSAMHASSSAVLLSPVSLSRVSTNVVDGRPRLMLPCCGSQVTVR